LCPAFYYSLNKKAAASAKERKQKPKQEVKIKEPAKPKVEDPPAADEEEEAPKPKQQEERVSASEDITVEPNPETEIVNDGAGHLEHTENAISEKCDEVIESLRKEVMTLRAKIRELEGRQRANEFTIGTVVDHGSPFQSPKTREGLSGDFTLNLSSLPSKNFVGDTFCNSQGEEELNLGTAKAGPVKVNTVIRVESVKDYTPYIRYTKLEFTVGTVVNQGRVSNRERSQQSEIHAQGGQHSNPATSFQQGTLLSTAIECFLRPRQLEFLLHKLESTQVLGMSKIFPI
jgi:hypothetical protein